MTEATKQTDDDDDDDDDDEHARMQHEIKMTDDPLYQAWWIQRQREIEVEEYGIDED